MFALATGENVEWAQSIWEVGLGVNSHMEHTNENSFTQVRVHVPPGHHWNTYMSSHGMFPSSAVQQNPFNPDLPEHLAKDGMFQTMDHYEKACLSANNNSSAYYQWSYSPLFLPPSQFSSRTA